MSALHFGLESAKCPYQATQRIRQWEREQTLAQSSGQDRPHLPIIALTANAFESDRQHAQAVGMDDFLTKPIMVDALESLLNKWLSGRGALGCALSIAGHRALGHSGG